MIPASLGHYRIVRPIGAGGMGDVYLADDTKLGRQVALKVLTHVPEGREAQDRPSDGSDRDGQDRSGFSSRAERRQRFEREARAVAALNHPNIITIYSVEEHEAVLFLTMEYVEGRTLTDLIPREGMSLAQWLQMAMPLADAVGAAHQRGITHRDLKAANVMVGTDGRLKVLDFGLAKVRDESRIDGLSRTMSVEPLTGEGRILGTVAYMSPEQAQGKPVDARSDVFSLGILLFEMATGQKPFQGDTSMSVLSAIIKDTPASVTDLRADLPRDVGRVLRRCLAKDPEERYQTAKDLRADLRLLKEDVDSDASGRTQSVTATRPRPRASRAALWLALGAVAVIAAGAAWWYTRPRGLDGVSAFASFDSKQLTNTGSVTVAAISPDGRYVVHDGEQRRQAGAVAAAGDDTGAARRSSNRWMASFWGLTFSPDGENVLYLFAPPRGSPSLFRMPLLGGAAPSKLVENIETPPAFSPDGAAMAFLRTQADGTSVIVRTSADGTGEQRVLAKRDRNDPYSGTRLAWSPDGTMIASFAGRPPGRNTRVVLVNADTGDERALGEARFFSAGDLFWVGDGSAVVFDAIEILRGRWNWQSQLWSVAYPAGALRWITRNDASYQTAAATKDGRTLVAIRDELRASLWVAPDGDSTRAGPITRTSTGREGAVGIEWTPDGRIVYAVAGDKNWNLWIAKNDGADARQLTNDGGTQPQLRPDGTGLFYGASGGASDGAEIRSMDLDGTNDRPIETGGRVFRGNFDVSATHLYLTTQASGLFETFRVPIAGGARERLFTDPASVPPGFIFHSLSPDGRRAAGTYSDGEGLAAVSIDGSARTVKIPHTDTSGLPLTTWAPGAQALEHLVVKDGTANIWRFPLDGSAPRPVTAFTSEDIFRYRWSRDGKMLALSRGTYSTDVVLIKSLDSSNAKE